MFINKENYCLSKEIARPVVPGLTQSLKQTLEKCAPVHGCCRPSSLLVEHRPSSAGHSEQPSVPVEGSFSTAHLCGLLSCALCPRLPQFWDLHPSLMPVFSGFYWLFSFLFALSVGVPSSCFLNNLIPFQPNPLTSKFVPLSLIQIIKAAY